MTPEEEIRDLVGLATFGEGVLSDKDEHRIVKVALARGLGPAATRAAIDGALAQARARREKPAKPDSSGSKKGDSERALEALGARESLHAASEPASAASESPQAANESPSAASEPASAASGPASPPAASGPASPPAASERASAASEPASPPAASETAASERERAIRKVISRRFDREPEAKAAEARAAEKGAEARAAALEARAAEIRAANARAAEIRAAEAKAAAADTAAFKRAAEAKAAAADTAAFKRAGAAASASGSTGPTPVLTPAAPGHERAADSEVIVAELVSPAPGSVARSVVPEVASPATGRAPGSEAILAEVVVPSPLADASPPAVCAGCLAPVPPHDVVAGRAVREPDGRVHCRTCHSRLGAGLVCAKCFLGIERVQLTDGRARAIGERAFHITCLPLAPAAAPPPPAVTATPPAAVTRTRTPIEIEPTSPILGASKTSRLGNKCGGCFVMLTSRDFETGRARRIEGVPYCIACAQRTSKGQG